MTRPDDNFLGEVEPLLPGIEDDAHLGSELLESVESQQSRYSGKIVDRNQARVGSIIAARAMGFSVRQVCSAYHIGAASLAELERRHGQKLSTLKDRLARKFGVFVEMGVDRAISELPHMDIDKLMISLGIATDKLQVLSGEPSVIVGTDDRRRFTVEALSERLGRREIIDVTPVSTGSDAGTSSPTREAAASTPNTLKQGSS
jgi:hypothetical protein